MRKTLVIVGQTASGKSELAIKLAKKFNGEIICADSRTIYQGMDIGTAKPTEGNQTEVKHHLLDVVEPSEEFSAAEFKQLALQKIKNISGRGKLPLLVGGTGLYINGVVYDYGFGSKKDIKRRHDLEQLSDERLYDLAKSLGIGENEVNFKNRRHLIRAVERGGVIKEDSKLQPGYVLIGIKISPDELKNRIKARLDDMLSAGLKEEVQGLADRYGFDAPGMNAICYREWRGYLDGEQAIEQVKQNLYKHTWQYAKRQKTWFKRDKNIQWITSVEEASVLVQQFLIQ